MKISICTHSLSCLFSSCVFCLNFHQLFQFSLSIYQARVIFFLYSMSQWLKTYRLHKNSESVRSFDCVHILEYSASIYTGYFSFLYLETRIHFFSSLFCIIVIRNVQTSQKLRICTQSRSWLYSCVFCLNLYLFSVCFYRYIKLVLFFRLYSSSE